MLRRKSSDLQIYMYRHEFISIIRAPSTRNLCADKFYLLDGDVSLYAGYIGFLSENPTLSADSWNLGVFPDLRYWYLTGNCCTVDFHPNVRALDTERHCNSAKVKYLPNRGVNKYMWTQWSIMLQKMCLLFNFWVYLKSWAKCFLFMYYYILHVHFYDVLLTSRHIFALNLKSCV